MNGNYKFVSMKILGKLFCFTYIDFKFFFYLWKQNNLALLELLN